MDQDKLIENKDVFLTGNDDKRTSLLHAKSLFIVYRPVMQSITLHSFVYITSTIYHNMFQLLKQEICLKILKSYSKFLILVLGRAYCNWECEDIYCQTGQPSDGSRLQWGGRPPLSHGRCPRTGILCCCRYIFVQERATLEIVSLKWRRFIVDTFLLQADVVYTINLIYTLETLPKTMKSY